MRPAFRPARHLGLTLCGLCAASAVLAAPPAAAPDSSAQQRYRQERAACLDGRSQQARHPCLHEAAAALADARQGRLDSGESAAVLAANALKRCAAVRADDRQACERLARGEGQVSGSVGQGGLFKQIVTRDAPELDPAAAPRPARQP